MFSLANLWIFQVTLFHKNRASYFPEKFTSLETPPPDTGTTLLLPNYLTPSLHTCNSDRAEALYLFKILLVSCPVTQGFVSVPDPPPGQSNGCECLPGPSSTYNGPPSSNLDVYSCIPCLLASHLEHIDGLPGPPSPSNCFTESHLVAHSALPFPHTSCKSLSGSTYPSNDPLIFQLLGQNP